jgi:hypothetical protein
MIIARLQGGLGNQLFQYAAAKALAVQHNVPLKLDATTALPADNLRQLALHQVNATVDIASAKEISQFVWLPSLYRHSKWISKLGRHIYREKDFSFDPGFFQLVPPVFLDGYWQSEKYFQPVEALIRQEFMVKKTLLTKVEQKAREIHSRPSVSVHIRRGDFQNKKAAAYHGVLPIEYYAQAMDLLYTRFPNAFFYLFTDDVNWVSSNFNRFVPCELVSAFTTSPIEDFYLMQQCNHHIIANSSFSWWAAWLNTNKEKVVITPKKWFAQPGINTKDLIPENWMQL